MPRVMGRLRVSLVVGLSALGLLCGLASSASAATTCKTVTQVHHGTHLVFVWHVVHGKRVHVYRRETVIVRHTRKVILVAVTVRRAYATTAHVKVCETAVLSIGVKGVPSTGGSAVLRYSSKNASSCTLASSPTFWTGTSAKSVACNATYDAVVPPSSSQREWTFRFTAKNRDGQSISSTQTLIEYAPVIPGPVSVAQSSNWSGYADVGGPFTAVQGTFNVPELFTAPTETDTTEWVGIDGVSDGSLIQAGISEEYDPTVGGVYVWAWWEILPAPETPIASIVVGYGDRVTVQIARVGGALWSIQLTDDTTGQTFTTEQNYAGPGTSAEWVVEAPSFVGGGVATLGDYAPDVTFGGLGVDGSQVGLDELLMVQGGGVVSSPSALDPNGFSVAYGAVPPAGP